MHLRATPGLLLEHVHKGRKTDRQAGACRIWYFKRSWEEVKILSRRFAQWYLSGDTAGAAVRQFFKYSLVANEHAVPTALAMMAAEESTTANHTQFQPHGVGGRDNVCGLCGAYMKWSKKNNGEMQFCIGFIRLLEQKEHDVFFALAEKASVSIDSDVFP